MVTHLGTMKPNEFGGFNTHTLCRRTNKQSRDGMNSTHKHDEVTCKFCLRLIRQGRAPQ